MVADAVNTNMSPAVRKAMLTVHLVLSIGWIGAVVAYLALDVAAVGPDGEAARAAWGAMGLTLSWVIVPLAIGSLVTGLVMSLGTPWGLFRHYWVLISFALTLFAVVVLVEHTADVSAMAAMPSGSHGAGRGDFLHAGGGLIVLLVVTTLNVFKPRGYTPYGWRVRLREQRQRSVGARQ